MQRSLVRLLFRLLGFGEEIDPDEGLTGLAELRDCFETGDCPELDTFLAPGFDLSGDPCPQPPAWMDSFDLAYYGLEDI